MASRNAQLANAVKSALNTAAAASAFKYAFTAKRVYVPYLDETTLSNLSVTVFSGGEKGERVTREDMRELTLTVQVGIQKRIRATDPSSEAANAELDDLTEFTEQIADFFNGSTISESLGFFLETELAVAGAPEHLQQFKVFTGLVLVTFLRPT